MFYLCDRCSWESCIGGVQFLPWKIGRSIFALYVHAVLYLVAAIYLNEVVPQQYGVPRHPLFPIENLIRRLSPQLHK